MEGEVTARILDEILDEYRNAHPGGHVVGGRALRQLVGEIDRLRHASPSLACGKCGQVIYIPALAERHEIEPGVMLEVVREADNGR